MGIITNVERSNAINPIKYCLMALTMLVVVISSFANAAPGGKKGGGGGGGSGGNSGGDGCTDDFPSFIYTKDGKGKNSLESLYLSSSEGCRTVKLADIDPHSDGPKLSYNNGQGLIAWTGGDDLDLWIIRFSVDSQGNVAVTAPELALATKRPTTSDPSVERFFGVDVWTDYATAPPTERASVYAQLEVDPSQGDYLYSMLLLDLTACTSGSGICSSVLIEKSIQESIDCIDATVMSAGTFDPATDWDCLIANKVPKFDISGDHIYYRIDGPNASTHGDWAGIARSTTDPSAPVTELVLINDASVETPARGHAATLDLGSAGNKQVYATHACIGSSGGVRDCRLYFLDVEACIGNPGADWLNDCTILYSGEAPGFDPSWRTGANGDLEILYLGWGSPDFDTVRALDPQANPLNSRQIISDGKRPDSAL